MVYFLPLLTHISNNILLFIISYDSSFLFIYLFIYLCIWKALRESKQASKQTPIYWRTPQCAQQRGLGQAKADTENSI